MATTTPVYVPSIGEFQNIAVIEILVAPGSTVRPEDSLITLESDKATMDIPSPAAGVVTALHLKPGDKVSAGSLILTLDTSAENATTSATLNTSANSNSASAPAATPAATAVTNNPKPAPTSTAHTANTATSPSPQPLPVADLHTEVLVIGGGPGGYTAAFRSADLGKKTMIIERFERLGGVCLNVGCIPSKALLHSAKVITDAAEAAPTGIRFAAPQIDIDGLRNWKDGIISKLTKGLSGLAKQRKVSVLTGVAQFTSAHTVSVNTADGVKTVAFEQCIIAAGSAVAKVPGFPYDDPRLIDSTGALQLNNIPKNLLIIGGGIIGLEMATVYDALGSNITVVELMDGLIPGADRDIVRVLSKRIEKRYAQILLKTKVTKITPAKAGLAVTCEGPQGTNTSTYDAVLVAVGRRPNGHLLDAARAGLQVNERGFIPVDRQQRTNVPHIFAIGDICGEPMLAHKATHEGKLAAEVIAGHNAFFDARTIPSVAYTDPEIAWMGLTETQAQAQGIEYDKAIFPWAASGRALATGREEGMTKALFDKKTRRLLGVAIAGVNAGELIAEAVLALEMGADAGDIGLTIHPHPTLSETLFFAAEIAEGSITDLFMPKTVTKK
jgi:dihydrolipoamide dehydrogenase